MTADLFRAASEQSRQHFMSGRYAEKVSLGVASLGTGVVVQRMLVAVSVPITSRDDSKSMTIVRSETSAPIALVRPQTKFVAHLWQPTWNALA
ncbi:MAG: hypothetical protein DWH73_00020 [Planctomycetota bacterium]|nr:MAG: hypothetical protein DWH73_00020 [Planctomycetota bacterium]